MRRSADIWQHLLFLSLWRLLLSVVLQLHSKEEIRSHYLFSEGSSDARCYARDGRGMVNKMCKCGFWRSTGFGAASHSWSAFVFTYLMTFL